MKVWFVGAGPGDPELLTLKAKALLEKAECCIYAGSLVNPVILDCLPESCEKYDSAGMDLPEIIAVMEKCRDRGVDVIRLHTGEPAIYGAIGEQMRELDRIGIEYAVVPGISSFQAAAASLQVELTSPEVSQTVILTRCAGRTPVPETQQLDKLAEAQATLCLFLSVGKLAEVCADLAQHYGEDCPAALVYHASWADEKKICGTLATLPELASGIERTAMIIVGRALNPPGCSSKLYASEFTHGYRKGTK
ncbi:MAG: precorrin-4 C(11)-methyltransferase [Planctomycetes bacterium]|nr:precorrin-4 C(11)-methyltransferase [Planctomycetota bacterium]